MADIITKEQRSYIMSQIRSKNTKPELVVRKFLFANGLRYRIHEKKLPGSPDIVLPKYKTVVFIHGCFWHHHTSGCRKRDYPKTNKEYWERKISRNVEKDALSQIELTRLGWKTIVVWECDLKKNKAAQTLESLLEKIKWV